MNMIIGEFFSADWYLLETSASGFMVSTIQDYVLYAREFLGKTVSESRLKIRKSIKIFKRAEMPFTMVFSPSGWHITDNLIEALVDERFGYVAGSFDSNGYVNPTAKSQMSGIKGVDLFFPTLLRDRLINVPRSWDI